MQTATTSLPHLISATEFCGVLGNTSPEFARFCARTLEKEPLEYRKLDPGEYGAAVLKLIKRVDDKSFMVSGEHTISVWEDSWSRLLERFQASNGEINNLMPDFVISQQPVRMNQQLVMPLVDNFEWKFANLFRHWLFQTYFSPVRAMFDFGCGSGYNVVFLSDLFPDKRVVGLDWCESSSKLLGEMKRIRDRNIVGGRFDFYHPDPQRELSQSDGVLTYGALEQVGSRFEPFLQFLLERRPAICVHVEPIEEWYDETHLVDYLALRYHKARNYLSGFCPRLEDLERSGRIEILGRKRLYFGSFYHEVYSFIAWRPVR